MTDNTSTAATSEAGAEQPAGAGTDGEVAEIRRQRNDAQRAGDRETAQMFDSLEREFYDANEKDNSPESAPADSGGTADSTGGDHTPLTGGEASEVFDLLDDVDPDSAAALRREWGGDAGANLGYAHLWFTTQYTQDERDSMVVTPGLVSMAARMGRQLTADRRAARVQPRDARRGGAAGSRKEPGEIRRLKEEAQRKGDYRLARTYDEQERAAYARRHGAGPIVGQAGRKL